MDVILLERVAKLGQMGETVKVKDGYARNFLLPQGKALRANKANLAKFEAERAQLEARNLERKSEAEGVASTLDGATYIIIRSAGETGQLYGSVAARDIAEAATADGVSVSRGQVRLERPIKSIGLHPVIVQLHPEVEVTVTMNVARSEDEAERQAAGEDLTVQDLTALSSRKRSTRTHRTPRTSLKSLQMMRSWHSAETTKLLTKVPNLVRTRRRLNKAYPHYPQSPQGNSNAGRTPGVFLSIWARRPHKRSRLGYGALLTTMRLL
jgi:large subunit ribosomal protein L9